MSNVHDCQCLRHWFNKLGLGSMLFRTEAVGSMSGVFVLPGTLDPIGFDLSTMFMKLAAQLFVYGSVL